MRVNGIDLENPDIHALTIEHIAKRLGMLCRFNGAVHEFYSVAEHSIHVSELIEYQNSGNCAFMMAGLLHDASEAITGDIITPVKCFLPPNFEEPLLKAIFTQYRVPFAYLEKVKPFDKEALYIEAQNFTDMPWKDEYTPSGDFDVHHWTPEEAMVAFMNRFRCLKENM